MKGVKLDKESVQFDSKSIQFDGIYSSGMASVIRALISYSRYFFVFSTEASYRGSVDKSAPPLVPLKEVHLHKLKVGSLRYFFPPCIKRPLMRSGEFRVFLMSGFAEHKAEDWGRRVGTGVNDL